MIKTNGPQLDNKKIHQQTTKHFKFCFEETVFCTEICFDLRLEKCTCDREKLLKVKDREFTKLFRSLEILNSKKYVFCLFTKCRTATHSVTLLPFFITIKNL